MQLRKAERKQAKLRIGMSGCAGSGKTYSALLMARGMASSWEKVAVIDTENGSAELYSDLGNYNVITLKAPFSPLRYVEAIKTCEDAEMEVIIIDSITHEWNGTGGCLELHEQFTNADPRKNSYTAWAKVTPLHDKFIQGILQSDCHIITTVRRKQEYEISKNPQGKSTVQKLGTKEITREGFEYELTINFEINQQHFAFPSKDRTSIYANIPTFQITEDTGRELLKWNQSGAKSETMMKEIQEKAVIENPASQHMIEKLKGKVKDLNELNKKCGTEFAEWNLISSDNAMNCTLKLM